MLGRGIDQILPHPSGPKLFEEWVHSALEYVTLAEATSGPIPRSADFDFIWGDALEVISSARPEARIVNLETAITTSEDPWPGKAIHYRMHPANVPCLLAAGIDCCTLANNHVLDWGQAGLFDTLSTLHAAGIRTAGAGRDSVEATRPAVITLAGDGGKGSHRLLVFSFGLPSSGIPRQWQAGRRRAGVNWLEDLSERSVRRLSAEIAPHRGDGTIVVASLHWGGNWGYAISSEEQHFAHALIDTAGVDLVHGHSSHHPKGIEVYRNKAILYGCGDLINDYEGIRGWEPFRADLTVMYFPMLDVHSGNLLGLSMRPMQLRQFRLGRAPADGVAWVAQMLDRECRKLGSSIVQRAGEELTLSWETG